MPAAREGIGAIFIDERPHAAAEPGTEAARGEGSKVARGPDQGTRLWNLIPQQRLGVYLRGFGKLADPPFISVTETIDGLGDARVLTNEMIQALLERIARPARDG